MRPQTSREREQRRVEKEARLRAQSRYRDCSGWMLVPMIVKHNDDLRQEQFASQLIYQVR